MATEKGPGWLKTLASGFKGARTGYKAAVVAEKAEQLRAAKRAAALQKAKATREANKAARLKAAEEAAAKSKRGRKPKGAGTPPPPTPGVKDLKEVKVSAPKPAKGRKAKSTTPADTKTTKSTTKPSTKKPTKKELAAQRSRDEKVAKRILVGAGVIGGGSMLGYGLFGNKKKSYKAVDDPTFQKQLKQYDDSLKKARGYKYGGTTATKAKKRK